jgi:thioredoxin-related protein
MKNQLLLILLAFIVKTAIAQSLPVDSPAYKRFPTIPPINILQIDSTILTKEKLKHQPTIIMYFSPDCDHCKEQWEEMEKHMNELKKYQILMITYQPFDMIVEFYKTHKIADYPNIKMGRDTKFMLPPFFRMNTLPYQALYDKNGNLITTFEGNVKIDKLLAAFNDYY